MTGPLLIYTTSTCAPCRSLCTFLDYKQIPYEKKVIDDDIDAQNLVVEMTGRYIVPTTVVGDRWISGYNPSEIMEAVDEANV